MYRPPPPRGMATAKYAGTNIIQNQSRNSMKRGSSLRPLNSVRTLSGAGQMTVSGMNVSGSCDPAASASDLTLNFDAAPEKHIPGRVNSRMQSKQSKRYGHKSMASCRSAPMLRGPGNQGPLPPSSVGLVRGTRSQQMMRSTGLRPQQPPAPEKMSIKRWTGSGPPPPRPKGPPPPHIKKRPRSSLKHNFMTQSQRRISTKDKSVNRIAPGGTALLSVHGHNSPSSTPAEAFDEDLDSSPNSSRIIGEDGLGGEWSEHFDEEAEAWYYYNSRTGEATWVCPDLSTSGETQNLAENDVWQQFDEIQPTPAPDDDDDELSSLNPT